MKFDYYRAENINAALELMDKFGEAGKVIAGGTDLLIGIYNGKFFPKAVVDIASIKDISGINATEDSLKLGAAVTHSAICKENGNIAKTYTALIEACSHLGSPQVRNLATVGGNICNAAPSAETAPALIALQCKAVVTGASGIKEISLEDFFKGPSQTVLRRTELLTHLVIGRPPSAAGSAYFRLSPRNALDIAVVNVGVYVKLDPSDKFEEVRICLGAVAPTPVRASDAEQLLLNKSLSTDLIKEASKLAKKAAVPISDVRASASYRKEMVAVLTERAIIKAHQRAKQN